MRKRPWYDRWFAVTLVGMLLLSMVASAVPPTVTYAEENQDSEDSRQLRIHYQQDEVDYDDLYLWLWGDVTTLSEDAGEWPEGTPFNNEQMTDFVGYVDVEIEEEAEQVSFIAVTDDEDELTEVEVDILSEDMDEVWIEESGNVFYYEPIDFDTPTVRLHFLTEDGSAEPWSLWNWGNIPNPTDAGEWDEGRIPLSDEQVGDYGAYIDVEVYEDTSSFGFLFSNLETDEQTDDLTANVSEHQQFFVKEGIDEVFTNPYYVADDEEEEAPEEYEGEEDISVEASVNRDFHYNEHALLDVEIDNASDLSISRIEADTSAIGGSSNLNISPELNRVTLSASRDTSPGEYSIPVTVVDENGGQYTTETPVTIVEREKADGEKDWDEEVIYFMLTDRFSDGDESNNDPYDLDYDQYDNDRGTYQGGDFKGVTNNLDYLDDLGVDTVWLSPIVENVAHDVEYASDEIPYYGYHGYWAKDFEELNPHLGTIDEFHELIDEAASRDIDIMVDVVLNHPGYGMHPDDEIEEGAPEAYPTNEDREKFEDMIRLDPGSDDLTMELAGLPDFKTEEQQVREQIVDWQVDWIERSTTDSGNRISSYRVDTVKHVDDTTWQHFKNELVQEDPAFKLIGESWGANYQDDHGYLNTGTMDSLLDFDFKNYASQFVNGSLEEANETLTERNAFMDNHATLGQFLGSHDEDGFLYNQDGDVGKLKLAATLQLTAKGQPVIYYGEELGQSGADNWPEYDNRYDFAWEEVEDSAILDHYQSILSFRDDYSHILSRGDRSVVAGSNDDGYLIVEREYDGESVYVAFNQANEAQEVYLEVTESDAELMNYYSDDVISVETSDDDSHLVSFEIPAMDDGGTALLSVDNGQLIDTTEEMEETQDEVEDGFFRLHLDANLTDDHNLSDLGLWIWEDVASPSEDWPTGALNLDQAEENEGWLSKDIELDEDPEQIGFLINEQSGGNVTDDVIIDLLTEDTNEAWVTEDLDVFYYEPIDDDSMIRINYEREDEDYTDWGLWTFGDVEAPTEDWPTGAHDLTEGLYGAYHDLALSEDPEEIGFLMVNKETEEQTADYTFNQLDEHSQVFVREGDDTVYTNPYFVSEEGIQYAELLSETEIELTFNSVDSIDEEDLLEAIQVMNEAGEEVTIDDATIVQEADKVLLTGGFDLDLAPYMIEYGGSEIEARIGWRLKDELYSYDGDLGVSLSADGEANLKVWSPSADNVNVVLYDKDDQDAVITEDLPMTRQDRGVWEIDLDYNNTGIDDLTGYYYHYSIERDGEEVLALDPYAQSMATWDSSDDDNRIGKAAIVDPSQIGPDLDFADIDNFEKREDAIIYEAHVRDFTSDPSIEEDLDHQFGTFSAFIEKLDYIESLGVTHVQLLPVMSYYFADEFNNDEHLLDYSSTNNNYNWGYDPHSYFSLTGMYSEDPDDAEKRIEEFKTLIDEIHKRDMGVILDVVYNHTAREHIFEDLEPEYYHFMDADGTTRTSFGGGRLGTTHHMSRRILVDSIMHWVEEYKVDGFRFDMMGDHDAESIQIAYDEAKEVNPDIVMIGEGWVTYVGDETDPDVQPADQQWMQDTESVGSFSDEFRNELKSGFGSEGEPRFITGGARNVEQIFDNLTANPHNFEATNPGDVVPYIAAHDNLTLHDVIAQSIQKDPKDHQEEIHDRIRLGNLMVLTAQGTPFIHAGQEFGRTKQFRDPYYIDEVDEPPYKSTFMTDENGEPFEYPYFIHDSYDSTDAINMFEWDKATNEEMYPIQTTTQAYTQGLIELRRSTDAFRKGTLEEIEESVSMIEAPEIGEEDLVIAYEAKDESGDIYAVFVNADDTERVLSLDTDFTNGDIVVDSETAGTEAIQDPIGVELTSDQITLAPLTASVVRIQEEAVDEQDPDEDQEGEHEEEAEDEDTPTEEDEDESPSLPHQEIERESISIEADTIDDYVDQDSGNLVVNDVTDLVISNEAISQMSDDQKVEVSFDNSAVQFNFPISNVRGLALESGESVSFSINQVDTSEVASLSDIRLLSDVYGFTVMIGDEKIEGPFDEPVELQFVIDSDVVNDPERLHLVYVDDDGDLTYYPIQSFDAETGRVIAEVDHFSAYGVVELDEDMLDEVEAVDEEGLPDTATSMFNYLLAGAMLLISGIGLLIYKRKQTKQ
ncbi:pullulanase, extracellular [Pelagirhabdus alkalitolerans]|uniref:pullulanase n=1 Tax=Pelagirhabdus alkalitolerans TaxID=1612202 RepID=A0A1G6KG36_9BACI|nr:pullulanase [Pelagirhabdus alkalitolerans]SDC30062.1 pullulanase, extracellular [Pelagirhabdus alkalitolerans]